MFRKKYRWKKKVVEDIRSDRTHLDQVEFIHRAIKYGLENHPLFKVISNFSKPNRVNGANIVVDVTKEDWVAIEEILDMMPSIDEGFLIQLCAEYYMEALKHERPLPELVEAQIVDDPELEDDVYRPNPGNGGRHG
jgi:hypothetical protein